MTFGGSVAALDGISFTGIFAYPPLDFGVGIRDFAAAQRRAGQADAALGAKQLVGACLTDSIGQHCARIKSKFALVILCGSFKVVVLIKVAPAGLPPKSVSF